MPDYHQPDGFETRYEWLRPGQLIARRAECPLIIFPLAPLEYHGPHLPVGVDPISAGYVAHASCRKLGLGVVRPTMYLGTERERDPATLEALGFERDQYVVGMDFPARQWNSHYIPEEVFAMTVAAETRCLIAQGYKYVFIVNGHGAVNHNQVLRRLCIELTHTTPAVVDYSISFPDEAVTKGAIGHADLAETSLMMYYRKGCVDLTTLPPKDVPLKYADYSIVDDVGFTPASKPPREVPPERDPRIATAEIGRAYFDTTVGMVCEKIQRLIKREHHEDRNR